MHGLVEVLQQEVEGVLVGNVSEHERRSTVVEDPADVDVEFVLVGVQRGLPVQRGVGHGVRPRTLALVVL